MKRARKRLLRATFACAHVLVGCSAKEIASASLVAAPPPPRLPTHSPARSLTTAAGDARAGVSSDAGFKDTGAVTASPPCPEGMVFVDTTYCPKPALHCLKSEYNKPNHITICHAFAPGQRCLVPPRRQRFCIDRYEFPNHPGAHPPVMVSWYDGAAACATHGKRLCWQSEWESACEGPDKRPFPYGLERDAKQCNIDNPYVKPDLKRMYASRPEIAGPELLKLDQSVPSGARAGCVSGFGVHDLTGNVDEWVNAEEPTGKSMWAGLKGGAWGHVRNACRPMTTSHPPEFTYYFISFRCCADAAPEPQAAQAPSLWTPPAMPAHAPPGGKVNAGWTTEQRGPHRPPP